MGTQSSSLPNIMKVLILFAMLGYASAAVTCDECNKAAADLVARLLSEESLAEQVQILAATVCPQSPDPAACEEAVAQYWGQIAACLYPNFLGDDACVTLGVCTKRTYRPTPKDWTCEECTDIMGRLAVFMADPATIAEGVTIVQGECFCMNGDDHGEDCAADAEMFLQQAMPVLAQVLMDTTPELCQDIAGVC